MKVVFTDFTQPDLAVEEPLLHAAGLEAVAADPQCRSPEDVIRAGQDALALVVQGAPVTAEVLAALPELRIVSVPGIGVDAVDLRAAEAHGVWVANVPDANITEVACHALAMALALIRHLPQFDRDVRAGRWDYAATGPLLRPARMTLGILGLGRIGRLLAGHAASVFGRIAGYDPHADPAGWPAGVTRVADAPELFAASDVVSLHLPLTAETRGLVGAGLLDHMKPGGYLVNVSRGAILDVPALLAALDGGRLAGAALDVLPEEPPRPDDPVLRHSRVLLSPHAAFYSLDSDEELRRRSVTNILALLRGGRPQDVVVQGRR